MYFLLALFGTILAGKLIGTKKSKAFSKKLLDNLGWFCAIAVLLGICLPDDSFLYNQMVEIVAAYFIILPIHLVSKFKNRNKKEEVTTKSNSKNSDDTEEDLPQSSQARKRIVEKFNEKYDLMLNEQQIDSIVAGSFQNNKWAYEISDMDKKYSSVNEWFASKNGWLRAYLKVFNIQNVSSDFRLQRDICFKNFDEIFSSIDASKFASIDECVQKINNEFMTNFDDATYMIAYRFLQDNNKNYPLPSMGIIRNSEDIEELAKKYDDDTDVEANEATNNKNGKIKLKTH